MRDFLLVVLKGIYHWTFFVFLTRNLKQMEVNTYMFFAVPRAFEILCRCRLGASPGHLDIPAQKKRIPRWAKLVALAQHELFLGQQYRSSTELFSLDKRQTSAFILPLRKCLTCPKRIELLTWSSSVMYANPSSSRSELGK